MKGSQQFDRLLLSITLIIVVMGFFISTSASLGLFAGGESSFVSRSFRQLFLGIIGGTGVMLLMSKIPYTYWRQYALPIFLLSLGITALVFVPGFGFSHGGAVRWIDLGFITFQPVEILKVGFVIYAAGWVSYAGNNIKNWKYSILPFAILLSIVGGVLLLQPDTGSFLVITLAAGAMFIAAGARWSHIIITALLGSTALAALAFTRPYIQQRLETFFNPGANPFGASYQIQQSLIAIGSGRWFGRGLGQSIQKFNFLPEPTSDSIFAVFAEEWGFVGAALLLLLFTALILRGYKIAADSPDTFSRVLVVGLITLIGAQAFVNIGGLLGLIPLTGLPLIFISHGGTALVAALGSVGIILNVSRYT